jgi:hypothetical protein
MEELIKTALPNTIVNGVIITLNFVQLKHNDYRDTQILISLKYYTPDTILRIT